MRRILLLAAVALLVPGWAQAASFVLAPSSASVAAGRTFAVQVSVSSPYQAVNAVSGELGFPTDVLQVVSVSRTGSVVDMWVREPTFSNANGTVRFEGAILNPGYQGLAGNLLTVTFRAVGGGTAQVSFRSGAILANDGRGTNVISGLASARYVITALATPQAPAASVPGAPASRPGTDITSATHPSPDLWSRAASAEFSWQLPADVTGVQYGLDRAAGGQPGAATAGRIGKVTIPLIDFAEDGAYYFHLRYRRGDAAGAVQTRRILVDRVPPERLEVSEVQTGDPTEPRRELRVEAFDATSGVDRLEVTWDGGQLRVGADAMGRFALPTLPPGTHDVAIRAVDKAGNGRVAHAFVRVEPLATPTVAVERFTDSATILDRREVREPVVHGMAPGARDVLVRITPRGGDTREITVQVAEDGTWRLPYAPLALGVWEVRAVSRDERGALSMPSDAVTVSSETPLSIFLAALPWLLVFTLTIALLYALRRRRLRVARSPAARVD